MLRKSKDAPKNADSSVQGNVRGCTREANSSGRKAAHTAVFLRAVSRIDVTLDDFRTCAFAMPRMNMLPYGNPEENGSPGKISSRRFSASPIFFCTDSNGKDHSQTQHQGAKRGPVRPRMREREPKARL
jgi:hypothetical protein